MLDEKDLQAIQKLIEASEKRTGTLIEASEKRTGAKIDKLSESLEEVRGATNYMVEWIEKVEKKVDEIA